MHMVLRRSGNAHNKDSVYCCNIAEIELYGIPLSAQKVPGDVNADGSFNVSDLVLMQKLLLAVPDTELKSPKAGDLCEDGILDVFDLCVMRKNLIKEML